MAEEMERDRKKAFELQSKLQKFKEIEKHTNKANESRKWRKPDRSESVDKRSTKLVELLDAVGEIQVYIFLTKVLLIFHADSLKSGCY